MNSTDNFTTDVPSAPDLIGRVVNGLKIRQLLGEGGMGQVYLANQEALGIPRALKIIRGVHKDDEQATSRFRREAQVLSRLHHHHIIQVLDFGEIDEGVLFIAMEYIDGGSIEEYLLANGVMDLVSGLGVLKDIADALRYAHGEGVVHRDLKPGNIVLRNGDTTQAKIIDFGLVKLVGHELSQMTKLTQNDQIVGSPLYMSPEQIQSEGELTGAVDVYAIAGLAYELFSGNPVFRPEDHASILDMVRAHCNDAPAKLSERCRHLQVPEFLDTLLLACLAKNPDHRPSAEEVSFHFERLHTEAKANLNSASASMSMSQPLAAIRDEARKTANRWASQIWMDRELPQTGRDISLLNALGKQIEDELLALSKYLAVTTEDGSTFENHAARIERVREHVSNIELENALLASHAEEREGSRQADLMRQRVLMGSRIDELQTVLRSHFRELFVFVMGEERGRFPEAEASLQMLDELISNYMRASRG